MAETRLTLTLPADLTDMVAARVGKGEYTDAQSVIREALYRLESLEEHLERVLRDELPAQLAAIDADPSRLKPLEEAFDELEASWRGKAAKRA